MKLYDFGFQFRQPRGMDDELFQGIMLRVDKLDEIFQKAVQQAKVAANSSGLTASGKITRRAELAEQTDKQLRDLQDSWKGYEENAKGIELSIARKLAEKASAEDKLTTVLLQQEVRQQLRRLEPLELDIEYRAAVERGDELTASAIEEAPLPFHFADPELPSKLKSKRLAAQFPEQVRELEAVRAAQRTLASAVASVRSALRQQGLPMPRDAGDPIAELAGASGKAA